MEIIPSIQEPLREGERRWNVLKQIWCGFNDNSRLRLHDHIMISTYYVLKAIKSGRLKPGTNIREYLGLPKDIIVYMDSGGFSLLNRGMLLDIDPQKIAEIQQGASPDVAFVLDYPLDSRSSCNTIQKLLKKNHELAKLFLRLYRGSRIKLFGVIHALSEEDAEKEVSFYESLEVQGRTFDGYGIGSLVKRKNNYRSILSIVKTVRKLTYKPVHVFGISSMKIIYAFAKIGITSFDSFAFLRAAMYRELILPQILKRIKLHNIKHGKRVMSSSIPCCCPMCLKANSLGGVKYYARKGSIPSAELAVHNLIVIINEVKLINEALANGWFDDLLKERGLEQFFNDLNI